MPRYHLFLTSRPSADRKALDAASARCPPALDHEALLKAARGQGDLEEWVRIARSDRRADIRRIQRELAKVGCALAEEDEGGSFFSSLRAIGEELTDPQRRAATKAERSRGATEPSWLGDNVVPILAGTALLVVLAGAGFVGMALLGGGLDPRVQEASEASLPTARQASLEGLSTMATGDGEERDPAEEASADPSVPADASGRAGTNEIPEVGFRERTGQAGERTRELASEHPVLASVLAGACGLLAAALIQITLMQLPVSHETRTRLATEVAPALLIAATCTALLLFGPSFLRLQDPRGPTTLESTGEAKALPGEPAGAQAPSFTGLLVAMARTPQATAPEVPFGTLLWHLRSRTAPAPVEGSPDGTHATPPPTAGGFGNVIQSVAQRDPCLRHPGPFARMRCTLDLRRAESVERTRQLTRPATAPSAPSTLDLQDLRLRVAISAATEETTRPRDFPLARSTRAFLLGLGSGALLAAALSGLRLRRRNHEEINDASRLD